MQISCIERQVPIFNLLCFLVLRSGLSGMGLYVSSAGMTDPFDMET